MFCNDDVQFIFGGDDKKKEKMLQIVSSKMDTSANKNYGINVSWNGVHNKHCVYFFGFLKDIFKCYSLKAFELFLTRKLKLHSIYVMFACKMGKYVAYVCLYMHNMHICLCLYCRYVVIYFGMYMYILIQSFICVCMSLELSEIMKLHAQ